MILFALAVTATPSDNMDNVDVFWLAILAISWPLIVVISVFGIVATFIAEFMRSR
jgi:uncharacterized integral membrane protein